MTVEDVAVWVDGLAKRAAAQPVPCGESGDQHDASWVAKHFGSVQLDREFLLPSEWAERNRYLPRGKGTPPGPYRMEVTPYLREILDCFSEQSPIQEVACLKGGQLGFTVGVLENVIGYLIAHVKTAPVMMMTATDKMAADRLALYIVPMFQEADLERCIVSSDEKNKRKSGRAGNRVEFAGGGFLLVSGAQTPAHVRSFSVQVLLRDEIDEWPADLGKQGDSILLSERRTAAFPRTYKILDLSTPVLEGSSKIKERYLRGDQRQYLFKCLNSECRFEQELRWNDVTEDGVQFGLIWDPPGDGVLDKGSVRYVCKKCGHAHYEHDKRRMFSEANARWVPTATPVAPNVRSYKLNALPSPQEWYKHVLLWREAWDDDRNEVKDPRKLQAFYNLVLARTFKPLGQKLKLAIVSGHRRPYAFGQVPNKWAIEHCGGPVLLLTCTVDVHADNLAVAVFGWCRDRRAILVDYWRHEGATKNLDDPSWQKLRELINKWYVADDGKQYPVPITFVDAGYETESVYRFCSEYPKRFVYPIMGRGLPASTSSPVHQFAKFKAKPGLDGWLLAVDTYKDCWAAALRRQWSGLGLQPAPFFNAPQDATDKQLKELTVEVRREKMDARGNGLGVFEWHRPSGARNELWDLLGYADAALDVLLHLLCEDSGATHDWQEFYTAAAGGMFFKAKAA